MNKILLVLSSVIVFIVFITAGAFFLWTYAVSPLSSSPDPVSFTVAPGEPASAVAGRLAGRGLIRSALAAKIYIRATGIGGRIRPGGYLITPSSPAPDILNQLALGPRDIWITFPEGWRREQIALRLASRLSGFDIAQFLSLSVPLEGQLFPDTYLFPQSASPSAVIDIMLANFQKKSGLVLPRQTDILILASLVEREAKTDPDRGLIAGILTRRLNAGWPLQVDATVQYAADTANFQITDGNFQFWSPPSDTKFPSLYNTYLHPGLPPGPISNPGKQSILAALNPVASSYWYYLTGSDGLMHYSVDISGHNSNIDKYLQP